MSRLYKRHEGTGRLLPQNYRYDSLALKGDREMCLATGMDGYISKPTRKEAIREALEDCSIRDGNLMGN